MERRHAQTPRPLQTTRKQSHRRRKLTKEGPEVHAGNSLRFLFTHAEDKRYDRRVKAAQLIEKGINADHKKNLLLLYASAAILLSFAGYTQQSVYEAVTEQKQRALTNFIPMRP